MSTGETVLLSQSCDQTAVGAVPNCSNTLSIITRGGPGAGVAGPARLGAGRVWPVPPSPSERGVIHDATGAACLRGELYRNKARLSGSNPIQPIPDRTFRFGSGPQGRTRNLPAAACPTHSDAGASGFPDFQFSERLGRGRGATRRDARSLPGNGS